MGWYLVFNTTLMHLWYESIDTPPYRNTHTHTCIIHKYVCMYVCLCMCVCVRACVCVYTYIYVHIYMCVCVCVCVCVCNHMHTHGYSSRLGFSIEWIGWCSYSSYSWMKGRDLITTMWPNKNFKHLLFSLLRVLLWLSLLRVLTITSHSLFLLICCSEFFLAIAFFWFI